MRVEILRGVLTSLGPAAVGSIVDLPAHEALLNISNNKARLAPDPIEPAPVEPESTAAPVEVKRTRQPRSFKE